MTCITSRQWETARTELRPAVKKKIPHALFLRGMTYINSIATNAAELNNALPWFKSAADAGHDEAHISAAWALENLGQSDAAVPYLLRSAKRGYRRGKYELGSLLIALGSYDEGHRWLEEAAADGDPVAAHKLSQLRAMNQKQVGTPYTVHSQQ